MHDVRSHGTAQEGELDPPLEPGKIATDGGCKRAVYCAFFVLLVRKLLYAAAGALFELH
jgi:hypothetical protein